MGCGFQGTSPGTPIDASTPTADASVPADSAPPIDAQQCFGTGLLKNLCLSAAPTQTVTLMAPIDTDANTTCTQTFPHTGSTTAPDLCVIAGKTVTVQGTVTVKGSRALVLIAAETLTVMGTLDVSSTTNTNPQRIGAAANSGSCTAPAAPDNDNGGSGGGGGGGFATPGGTGGTGDTNHNGTNSSRPGQVAAGGTAGAIQDKPTLLRGGCRGGDGGTADGTHRGAGGNGGGAVYLIAGNMITIPGNVYACGAGGGTTPGPNGAEEGGGGGGTGGMIGIDAMNINIAGHVVANGGGGGGGGGGSSGGAPGGDGTTGNNWNQRATAGSGGGGGGGGGAGAPGTAVNLTNNIDGTDSAGGGGGAGGGLGIVWIDGTVTGGTLISPAPTPH